MAAAKKAKPKSKTTQRKLTGPKSGTKKQASKAPAKKRAKRPRTIKRSKTQTGTTNRSIDKKRTALPPGRRIAKSGKKYTEKRANRSDKNRKKGL